MKFAVACLLASSQAIKIRSSACPEGFKAASEVGYTNSWTIGSDTCFGANAAPTCLEAQRNTARDGRTVAITEGANAGCFEEPSLAQKKTCPEGFKAASEVGFTNSWTIGSDTCFGANAAPTCLEAQRNTARDGRTVAITEGANAGCFEEPSLAQKKTCPEGFKAASEEGFTNSWTIGDDTCFGANAAPTCTAEQRNTARDGRTVAITEGTNAGCFSA